MELEFIGPNDKPAMVLLTTPDWLETTKAALREIGYKVHAPQSHEEFAARFNQIQYQVVVTEVLFAASVPTENLTLLNLRKMPMSMRRHAVVVIIGWEFQTLNRMQAFQQSVHAVMNPQELTSLGQIIQQTVAENDLLYGVYRDTQHRIATGSL